MNPLTALARLPDATPCMLLVGSGEHTLGEVKRALATSERLELSTIDCSKKWGRTSEYWAKRCRAGRIHGAYSDGGRWRIPIESAEAYLRSLQQPKRRARKPWPTPQARGAGTPRIPTGKVLARRPSTLGVIQGGHAKPETPGLARGGRADGTAGGR